MPSALCPHLARVWRQPCISEVRWGMFNCESVTCPAGCWRLVRDCGPRPADQLISRHSVLAQLKVRRTKPQVTPPPSADDSPVPEQSVALAILNLKSVSVSIKYSLVFYEPSKSTTRFCSICMCKYDCFDCTTFTLTPIPNPSWSYQASLVLLQIKHCCLSAVDPSHHRGQSCYTKWPPGHGAY